VFFVLQVVVGAVWAIVNISLRRAMALNSLAVVLSLCWIVILTLALLGAFTWDI
jgi:hypothetical protein